LPFPNRPMRQNTSNSMVSEDDESSLVADFRGRI
jgi:hypothetical protein